MSTTATPIPSSSDGGDVSDRMGLNNGPRQLPIADVGTKRRVQWGAGPAVEAFTLTDRCRVDRGRGTVKPWQRLAVAIWDTQFLCAQRALYRAAPRLAAHLDELARRRDEERRKRP